MNIYYSVLVLVHLSILVDDSKGGLVDNLYGSIDHGKQEVRDFINDWWSYGKETLFGKDPEVKQNKNDVNRTMNANEGILGGPFNKIYDSYVAARKQLEDYVLGENNENKGVMSRLVDKMKNNMHKLKVMTFGEKDNNTTPNSQSQSGSTRKLFDFFIRLKKNGTKVIQLKAANVKVIDEVTEEIDHLKYFGEDLRRRMIGGASNATKYILNNREKARNNVEDLIENTFNVTEQEKQVFESVFQNL